MPRSPTCPNHLLDFDTRDIDFFCKFPDSLIGIFVGERVDINLHPWSHCAKVRERVRQVDATAMGGIKEKRKLSDGFFTSASCIIKARSRQRENSLRKNNTEPCYTELLKLILMNTGPQGIVGAVGSYSMSLDYKLQTASSMGDL